ncbi:MAG: cardiolipin synthetase [Rhodobacterales bacterium]|nr:MAG: cardiolipin synthetase [Rhodobacterales bacterium]
MSIVLTYLAITAGVLLTGTALIWVLQQRRSPQSALAWIIFIVAMPYLGAPLFFALGVRKRGTRYDPIRFAGEPEAPGPPVHCIDGMLRRFGLPAARGGHAIRLETDPPAARRALERLVAEAETSLDIVLYRLDPDHCTAAFMASLMAALERGVRVRMILDHFGTIAHRPRRALRAFTAAGGELRMFSPFPKFLATGRLNLRNHRKMVIADRREVWAGGRNVGLTYLGEPADPATWRDLSFTLEGPMVARYAEVFEADWRKEGEPAVAPPVRAGEAAKGSCVAQLVPSGPDLPHDGLHDALVHAIHTGSDRIWIATPYFLPSDQLLHALSTAARIGRDVRLLVPARSNQRIADFARGAYLRDLEEAGVKVLRYGPRMLHAKAVVLDDMAFIGSANIDIRSMLLNFETALVVYDAETVEHLAEWFSGLAVAAKAGTKPASLARRLAEAAFRLGAPIL